MENEKLNVLKVEKKELEQRIHDLSKQLESYTFVEYQNDAHRQMFIEHGLTPYQLDIYNKILRCQIIDKLMKQKRDLESKLDQRRHHCWLY